VTGIFVYYNSYWLSVKLFDSQVDNNIIRLSYFCGCLTYFINFITLLLTAQSRSKEYAIVTITRVIINNILSFYFIIQFSLTFMAKIYAAIITQLFLVLILLFLIRDMIGFKFSLSKLKKSLIFSYPNAPRSIIGLIYKSFDKILLNKITGIDSVGYYAIGSQLANTIKIISNSLGKAFNRYFFDLSRNEEPSNKSIIVERYYQIAYFILFFGLCLIIFSEEIITIFTSSEFKPAMYILPVYVFYHLFAVLGFISVPQIMFAEKMIYLLPPAIISIIINILLNIALIPSYGAVGAALATAIAQLVTCIVIYYFGQKAFYLPVNLSKILKLFLILLILSFLVYPIMISNLNILTKLLLKIVIVSLYVFYGIRKKIVSSKLLKAIFKNVSFGV